MTERFPGRPWSSVTNSAACQIVTSLICKSATGRTDRQTNERTEGNAFLGLDAEELNGDAGILDDKLRKDLFCAGISSEWG